MQTRPQKSWWEAVLRRDKGFDGTFVYAVRSTGIYCRPSCPARRPGRDQVVFFQTPEAAGQGGFRPCLRCHPDEAGIEDPHAKLAERLCRFIERYDSPDRPLTLSIMGEHLHVGPHHLQRIFKRVMDISPRQYAEACRLRRLKTLFKKGETVTRALYEAGYGSSSRLYEGALGRIGMTPGAYLGGGKGIQIGYAIVGCPLGRLLVAATGKGICAVSIGENDEALKASLFKEYPEAGIRKDRSGLDKYVTALLTYLDGTKPCPNIPLDIQATAFERRVYEALRNIPFGHTRTYREIAEEIGSPKAARAVARACASNPVAIVIPCHRVVRKDGGPGGYRWGIKRKKTLLANERSGAS
jgi:AraC family transcriptional regulator of adaptative response/methylated-DNA-[protein]-cysteine methyltransferase